MVNVNINVTCYNPLILQKSTGWKLLPVIY